MQTLDGYDITTIEQEGTYAGEDLGRILVHHGISWVWYGGFVNDARRQEVLAQAQAMTFLEFDAWFDTAP